MNHTAIIIVTFNPSSEDLQHIRNLSASCEGYIVDNSPSPILQILSSLIYSIQLGSLRSGNMFLYTLLSYYCGLLGMGWFEFYYFHLAILEVPVMILMLMGIANVENRFREKIRQKHLVELTK